ncbi:MAG: sulfite exporter TauE/SafE family protein, partial [Saprospiraceae bacterium]|nr:sulfite exporter TauE/SafE family protein [Saprospiraceae bacterium]
MSWEIALYVCLVVWLASTLQGIIGAGFNIISVPALVVILPAQLVVPGLVGLYLPLLIVQVLQLRSDIDWRRLVTLAGSSVVMLPIGAMILKDTDAVTMQRIIGWSMIALALLILVRPGPPFQRELIPRIGVGLIAGLLATSTSVSGPPVVLLGLKQRWEPARFRGTLIAYFLIISTCALPFFWQMELLNRTT